MRSAEEFRKTAREGSRAGTRTLVVHLRTTEEPLGGTRVGFVVSKAVGNAVARNRVKRRLRHLVREQLGSLPGTAVLVVRAQPAAATASYAELRADLLTALGRVVSL